MQKLKRGRLKRDRLSELPESLILEILSLLNFRDVVKTMLLSKRWHSVWTAVPCLDFHERGKNFDQIWNLVTRALSLWRGTHLRKLSISSESSDESASSSSMEMDIASWVQFATERKVEDLCILLDSAGLFSQVFSSSPQLEIFTASCRDHPFQKWSIRSSSLKMFWIISYSSQPSVLTIWAPNLDSFKYKGTTYIKCSITDSKSLTKEHIDFSWGSSFEAAEKVLCDVLPAIKHVETVKLSFFCFRILRDIMSPLLNVKQLTIADTLSVQLSDILDLLESFPRLEMLIIHLNFVALKKFQIDAEKYIESEANILKSNCMLQLRTVVINCYVVVASFVEVIGFLLKHATMIGKLVIREKGKRGYYNSKEKVKITSMLTSLQRSFPSVELSFFAKGKCVSSLP